MSILEQTNSALSPDIWKIIAGVATFLFTLATAWLNKKAEGNAKQINDLHSKHEDNKAEIETIKSKLGS